MSRGNWLNDPVFELIPGKRDIRLPEDLHYVDRTGVTHTVPAGFVCDGMTSPAWTWSLIGAPITPEYRRPTALHDWYCVHRTIPAARAHALLRESLEEARPGRVWRWRVAVFDALVRWFGPRW